MLGEMEQTAQVFVTYEYKEATVDRKRASEYLDGYENFGWELDDAYEPHVNFPGVPSAMSMITLHLRRDRRIINKMELTRLQRQFEACMKEIQTLENSSETKATIYSLGAGVVGLAFLFCAVFTAFTAKALTWMNILLAISGVICCASALPIYKRVYQKRASEVEPLLDAKHEEICRLCEKGYHLTHL